MNRLLSVAAALLPVLFLSAGCNKPADSEAVAAPPAQVAGGGAVKASPVQQIQSNSHIPEQAKAAIVAHMQGPRPAK